jgi:MerR family mercuric resistance operon transcriptional regulator
MNSSEFSVGQIAQQVGCKVETVRYYEKIELMPEPPRSEGGHRIYNVEQVKRLNFIRRSRELGFSIEKIRELLSYIDEPDHYCGEVKGLAILHSREVQKKIDDLERLKVALNTMVSQCAGKANTIDNCPIIDALYVQPET